MKPHRIRIFFCILLSIVFVLSAGTVAFAEQNETGLQYIADISKKTAQIIGYTGTTLNLKIPKEIGGYTVTSLKSGAFKNQTSLLSVTIPDTVTTIGSECFSGCSMLTSVDMGKGVSSIGSKAFENCGVLATVTMSPAASSIGAQAFYGCKFLSTLTLSPATSSIGTQAFYGCKSLKALTLPASTSSIGAQAFCGCEKLSAFSVSDSNLAYKAVGGVLFNRLGTTLIAYPPARKDETYDMTDKDVPQVTSIESYAFCGAKNLTNIKMSAATVTVGKGAFKDCTALTEITLPQNLTKLEDEMFSGCKKLVKVHFQSSIKTIGENTFAGCASISTLTIPDSVTTIGAGAFSDCTGLSSVTIGKGLTAVSGEAFSGCTGIKEYITAEGASFSTDKGVLLNKDGTRLIAYPAGSAAEEYKVGEKVTTIGADAFDSCKNLKKLHIPTTVKKLAEPAVIKNCGDTVIYVDDDSAAKTYFQSHTTGYAALKIGDDKPGDVNADGQVDNADVILLRRYVAKWSNINIQKNAADVNKDSEIDNADVILLRRFVAGWKNVTLK